MKKIVVALACLIVCLISTAVMAQTKAKVALGEVWGSTVREGDFKSNPTASTLGLALTIPMSQSWLWYAEGGLATPNSSFYPSPRTVQGPAYKLSQAVCLGLTAAYQYNPAHGKVEWSHSLGVGPFVAVSITKEIGLTFVLGGGKGLRHDGPWSIAFQPRVSFTLPF